MPNESSHPHAAMIAMLLDKAERADDDAANHREHDAFWGEDLATPYVALAAQARAAAAALLAAPGLVQDALTLRKLLWLHHGHDGLYGDDGEMQCALCPADFKRDDVARIEATFDAAMWKRIAEHSPTPEAR